MLNKKIIEYIVAKCEIEFNAFFTFTTDTLGYSEYILSDGLLNYNEVVTNRKIFEKEKSNSNYSKAKQFR